MTEAWVEIPGYGGWYEASSQGRVRSWRVINRPGVRADQPHIMGQHETRGGYLFVNLAMNGRQFLPRLNRLILLSFIGESEIVGAHACHRNGDRQDNRLENLYWGSPAENAADKRKHGTHLTGERVGTAKLTVRQVKRIRRLYADGGTSYKKLAKRYRVSTATIGRAIRHEYWKEA